MLVGRELSLFLHLDAGNIPARQREGFVAMQVRRAAPFNDPEHDVAWFGNHAAVWYWSAGRVRDLAASAGTRTRFRAEGCFRGEPMDEGLEVLDLRLQALDGSSAAAGHEARVWRKGHLAVSRWWARAPDTTAWNTFLRGAGLDPSTPILEPTDAVLRDAPLGGGMDAGALADRVRGNWPLLATGTGAVVAAVLCWQLASVLAVNSEIGQVADRIGPLERELEAIIDARARADEASAEITALLDLRPPASQTQLLAEVQAVTPGGDWAVSTWHQPGPDMVEVTLQGTGLDASAVVTAWEESPLLQDVTPATSRRGDELMLRATLTPLEQRH